MFTKNHLLVSERSVTQRVFTVCVREVSVGSVGHTAEWVRLASDSQCPRRVRHTIVVAHICIQFILRSSKSLLMRCTYLYILSARSATKQARSRVQGRQIVWPYPLLFYRIWIWYERSGGKCHLLMICRLFSIVYSNKQMFMCEL